MKYQGNLLKMRSKVKNDLQYYLETDEGEVNINDFLGQPISLKYLHQINCIGCGKKTTRSFSQGYCFSCFQSSPQTEDCVLRPELCKAHEGIARNMEYAETHCLIDHYVYLSFTSGVKVGITRNTQIPTRWIDQGALAAVCIAKTPNRYTAGLIEVALKKHFSDKTNWKIMLTNTSVGLDLLEERKKAIDLLPYELKQYVITNEEVFYITYPIEQFPEKIISANLDKNDFLSGTLIGIKGQYLLFDSGEVINIRSYAGYRVELEIFE